MTEEAQMEERKTFLDQCYGPTATLEEIQTTYDKYSTQYDKLLHGVYPGPKRAADGLAKFVPDKKSRILDCAAGTGLVGEELHRLGYDNVDAIDMSEESLKIARDKGVYKKMMCATLSDEPIEGVDRDTYDAIIACGCFLPTHINDSVLTEWIRIVKTGGFICILANEKYNTTCVEGDVFKQLVEDKKIEVLVKYKVENHIQDVVGAIFYAIKRLR